MNTRILLLAICAAAISSCSSVYKSGQTPDDVYFSPARPQEERYVEVKKEKNGNNYQTYEQYQDNYRDDRFLRMSIGNSYYRNAYNNYSGFDWRYNSFYEGFNYGFSSPWNNYFAWNNFYNPYGGFYGTGSFYGGGYYGGGYGGTYYGGGSIKYSTYTAPISRPLVFNVNSYSPGSSRPASRNNYNSNNSYYNNNRQRYNNGNNGSSNRSIYSNNNNSGNHSNSSPSGSNSNNTYTPSRSYTPSSSSGSSSSGSSGGSSGGGGGVSRPARGN